MAKERPEESPENESRLFDLLMSNPISDGGDWQMAANLIRKYGVMPKNCFSEALSSTDSNQMNFILKTKLREFAYELRKMVTENATDEDIITKIKEQMLILYRVVSVCLGCPPETFTWEFYDKDKEAKKIGPITPLEFYEQHLKPLFNIEDKVVLGCDPRNPYGKLYTNDIDGNVTGAQLVTYNNQPIETLIKLAAESIKNGEAVMFTCDVEMHISRYNGLLDPTAHNFDMLFGTEIHKVFTKAERLMYKDTAVNHAMLLTGVDFDEEGGEPSKFRVENSCGEDGTQKGYLTMTKQWFEEYVFSIVVDKSTCSKEILDVFEMEPQVLPFWNPL